MYRATGASIAKAQQEFTNNVMSNEGVRNAAAQAAASAVRSNLNAGQVGKSSIFLSECIYVSRGFWCCNKS